jgi:hypothetical protein
MIDINSPSVRQVGAYEYELVEDFIVRYHSDGHVFLEFTVPAGFITDFATAPLIVGWLIQKQGDFNRAAVLHDYLYTEKTCSRFLADALFRDVMREIGVPLWRRIAMYYAVRFFGWTGWKKEKS